MLQEARRYCERCNITVAPYEPQVKRGERLLHEWCDHQERYEAQRKLNTLLAQSEVQNRIIDLLHLTHGNTLPTFR